jgi:hypothetical protein
MPETVLYEDATVRISNTEVSFGPNTYPLDQIKEVEGYYQRTRIAWLGAVLGVAGALLLFYKSMLFDYSAEGLYQVLNFLPLPMVGIGAALFVFASKYAIRLHTTSGPVEVLAVRNRAYAQNVANALTEAVRARASQPVRPAVPASKKKR